jgi:hypothetical protein
LESETVDISLTRDEAVVLFEWLHRVGRSDALTALTEDEAELVALWALSARLETRVDEPLRDNYPALLEAARVRLSGSA